MKDVILQA